MKAMKPFGEMNQSEINALSKEEFKSISPFEKKSCYDCGHLKHALSWWCSNSEAIKARGTSIPGCVKCSFWKPDWKIIPDQYKTDENGYSSSAELIKGEIVVSIAGLLKKSFRSANAVAKFFGFIR